MPFVLNLPVRKIKGIESFGMILMAENSAGEYQRIGDDITETGSIII